MNPIDITNKLLMQWFAGVDIRGRKIYLAGGSVRDLLMGRSSKDLDLVCRDAKGLAYAIAAQRNAAVVDMEKKPGEPCYRLVDRSDLSDFIDIAEMRGETIDEDLRQRDFTVNAIAMDINGDIGPYSAIDPLGGFDDIKRQLIRMTGPKVISADPLRILRAVRLRTHLGFEIETETLECLKASADLLSLVSAERTMAELFMVLEHASGSRAFRTMDTLGITDVIFPEILPMKGCAQNGYHHLDVWEHSLLVMESVEMVLNRPEEYFGAYAPEVREALGPRGTELMKLTALLHDIGKPSVRGYDQNKDRITFYGHEKAGAAIIRKMSDRLRMSGSDSGFILKLVENHLRPIMLYSPKATNAVRMRWYRKMGEEAVPSLILSMADVMSSKGPASGEAYRDSFVKWASGAVMDYFADIKNRIGVVPLLTGHDLIAAGMEPGPRMGLVLRRIRAAQDTGAIRSREDAIALADELIGRTR